MATFQRFEDIVAWQRAKSLATEVYRVTGRGALRKDFALRDQLQRAAISAMANIAEGFERDGRREFVQFLSVAKGSVGELRSHLYVVADQGLLTETDLRNLFALAEDTSRTIAGLMRYLRSTAVGGSKFHANLKLET